MVLTKLAVILLLPLSVACQGLSAVTYTAANLSSSYPPHDPFVTSQPEKIHVAAGNPNYDRDSWQRYVCRGQKLSEACKTNKDKAIQFGTPPDTRFDGTLEAELSRWGYIERNAEADDQHCSLFSIILSDPLDNLGIEGENKCFWFQHNRGEKGDRASGGVPVEEQTYKVGDVTYRNTYAKAIIGANAQDGVIYFIDRISAVSGAKKAWGVPTPPTDQLPELRQMSDMAWGVWRRVHPNSEGLGKIKYFFVNQIVNKETQALIAEAIKTYTPQPGQARVDEAPEWPRLTWAVETQEGAAMLGSPNGIAIGYFLSQHKGQLGGNKYVYQVQVYVDTPGGDPYMIFHIKDAPVVSQSGTDVHRRRHQKASGSGVVRKRR